MAKKPKKPLTVSDIKSLAKPLDSGPRRNRTTITSHIYHENVGDQPEAAENHFSRFCDLNEEAYVTRRMKLTTEWQPLDLGFIPPGDVWMVRVQNNAGAGAVLKPTEEEKAVIDNSMIHLCFEGAEKGYWEIVPGLAFFGCPQGGRLLIRGTVDAIPVKIHVYPR